MPSAFIRKLVPSDDGGFVVFGGADGKGEVKFDGASLTVDDPIQSSVLQWFFGRITSFGDFAALVPVDGLVPGGIPTGFGLTAERPLLANEEGKWVPSLSTVCERARLSEISSSGELRQVFNPMPSTCDDSPETRASLRFAPLDGRHVAVAGNFKGTVRFGKHEAHVQSPIGFDIYVGVIPIDSAAP
ncbi:MAG: hypothetical protein HYZ28_22530 [Myxococcales bacterium]|nr:hypothetical protein [Myxococcales bacterium]